MRSGDEPEHARSPLRLRLVLASTGLACWSAGAAAFFLRHDPIWALACTVGACLTAVNVLVVVSRIRAGAHWQPGRAVPPYRPVDPLPESADAPPPGRRCEVPQGVRVRRYLVIMGGSLLLLLLAWGWVWRLSMPAAETMSLLAMLLLPVAAVTANTRSRGDLPDLP